MSEQDTETLNSSNETTEEVDNTDAVEENDAQSGSEDLETLQEKNKRLFERAKKAEAEAKLLKAERLKREEQAKVPQPPVETPSKKQDGLTALDAIAIAKANIHEDDVEEVVRWAKYNNITIKDALKDKTMQTILRDKEEIRSTANATSTGAARRNTSKPSPESILENAAKGIFPEDPAALAEARLASRKK